MGSAITALLNKKDFPIHLLPSHTKLSPEEEAALRDVWLQFQMDHKDAMGVIDYNRKQLRKKRWGLESKKVSWEKIAVANESEVRQCIEKLLACQPNRGLDETLTLLRFLATDEIHRLKQANADLEIEIKKIEWEEKLRGEINGDRSNTYYGHKVACMDSANKRCRGA